MTISMSQVQPMREIEIPIEKLPSLYSDMARQVPFAAAGALNDVAFDARRALQHDVLPRRLEIKNRHAINSIRVGKASKTNLVAEVGSTAWYLERLVEGGRTKARTGYTHEGKSYLLIPAKRTRSGKVSKLRFKGKPFVIEKGGHKILVARRTSKRMPLVTIGFLVSETRHDAQVPWENEVEKVVRDAFPRRFAQRFEKAIATAKR